MRIAYTFRDIEPSDAIKEYASSKISKLQKYLHSPLDAEVTASKERHLHCIDLKVVGDGEVFVATEESEDMYASIDLAMDKMDRQIRRAKAQRQQRRRGAARTSNT
ncbi:MAG: ribosome-associated translation inhibitor RaiA [Myxococcales bacterium]|nr:ribosome-associated translation inhibitor RaiA [Myxococcales bacterium]